MTTTRKPIQIAALRFGGKNEVDGRPDTIETEVIALCDDGTIWSFMTTNKEWVPFPQIPQTQLLEDWLSDVGKALIERHIRKSVVNDVVDQFYDELVNKFRGGEPAADAAQAIVKQVG